MLEQEFASLYDEILATNNLEKAFHLTRRLCCLGLEAVKTPRVHQQLVTVAAKHPNCAGMIYGRLSKTDTTKTHLSSVIFKASGYMVEMDMARKNGQELDKANLLGITSIASFNPMASLKILGGYKNLSTGLNEDTVVSTMMRVVAEHPEVRVHGLTKIFERHTPQSLMAVSQALSANIPPQDESQSVKLTTQVLSELNANFKGHSGECGSKRSKAILCSLLERLTASSQHDCQPA